MNKITSPNWKVHTWQRVCLGPFSHFFAPNLDGLPWRHIWSRLLSLALVVAALSVLTTALTPPMLVHAATAPTITSASSATFTVGSAGTFTVTTTGNPKPTLSESGDLPTGVTFTNNTGSGAGTASIAGTPATGTGGVYHFTITASNGTAPDATQSFTLTVNESAVITSVNNTTFTTGVAGSFTITTRGYVTPTLTESGALPGGVSFTDNQNKTGTLAGTPAPDAGGIYPITITAHNGIGSDSTQNFTLTVHQAPAITSSNNTTFTVGSSGTFTVTATGYPASTLSQTGALPSGVSFNSTTGVLSGTPAGGTGGTYSLTFTAQNGVGTNATQSFTLTVNQGAAFTSATNTAFMVGTANSFGITTSGYPLPIVSSTGTLPSGISLTDNGNGTATLAGTPATGSGGSYPLTLTAHNGVGADATMPFTLVVNEVAAFTSADSASFTTGTAGTFAITTWGYPRPSITKSGSLPSGLTFTDNGNGTATLAGTPAAGSGGTYPLTLTAHNSSGGDATQSLTLVVNQPPAFTSADNTTFLVGTFGSFTVTTTGYPAVTLTASGTLPEGVTFDPATGVLSGTPLVGTTGVYPITFSAQNGVLPNSSQDYTLAVHQAPAITSANAVTFTVGTAGSFNVTATGYPAPTFSSTTLPSGLALEATTGVLSGTPAAGTGGTLSITLTAHNSVADATQTLTLAVDEAAGITSANTVTFGVGEPGSFGVTTTGYPAPTLIGEGILPTGVTFDPETYFLSGTPAPGTGGSYNLAFAAHNGVGADAIQSFALIVNEAAAITSPDHATFTVGTTGSFTVTATGFPTPTFTSTALPAGLVLHATSGVIDGTPAGGTGGTYSITLTAHNGVGTDASQNFALTVNEAPGITSANSTTLVVGTAGSFQVIATGYPAPTFSQTGVLPSDLAFNTITGVLSGTPAAGTGGAYNLTFKAHNGVGTEASQSFILTVNEAPAITSASGTTFTVGTAGSFTIVATGYPAPTLIQTGTLPTGITFNTTTGVLSGTPTAGSGGSYTITLTAQNGVGTDASQNFSLTVNETAAITSADHAIFTAGTAGSFTVTATGYPAPTYAATALPGGLGLNATTGVLGGTPAAGTGGSYSITLTAHNGVGADATQSLALTVKQAPAITSGNSTTFVAGTAGSFQVTATGYPTPTYSSTTLPAGVSLDGITGILSGTPAAGTGGVYTITITAGNGTSPDATQTFTLTVNEAPAITSANAATFTVGSAGTFTLTEIGYPNPTTSLTGTLPSGLTFDPVTRLLSGTPATGTGRTYSLTFRAHNGVGTDALQTFALTVNEAPAITSLDHAMFTVGTPGSFTVTALGFPALSFSKTGALPAGVTLSSGGQLSGTPVAGNSGVYTIQVTAHNGVGADATQTFTLTVNEAAAITSPNTTTFVVGAVGTFHVTATGYPAPALSQSGSLPSGVTFDAGTGILSGTPAAGQGGTFSFTFTAHNGVGIDAVQNFTLTVGQSPAITSPNNVTFVVGTQGSLNVTATGYPAPSFSETGGLPSGVTLSAYGLLSGTPAVGTGGTYPMTITASNGVALNANQTFLLTVVEPAGITSANTTAFLVGTSGSFSVSKTGYPVPTLGMTGTLPGGVTFNTSTGVLSGTPTAGSGGLYAITFTAHNGIGSDATQGFALTVNQVPAITSVSSTTMVVGTAGAFHVTATGYPVPTLSSSGPLPSGITFNAATGMLGGTPAAGAGGPYSITFTAHNGVGTDATQNFSLTVNEAAAITSANAATFTVGSTGSFLVNDAGYPAPTLSLSGSLPNGVAFDPATHLLSGTPAPGTTGTYPLVFTAHNGVGTDASQNFTLTVNQVAAITSANHATFVVGTAGSFTVTATGYPAPTFGLTGTLPTGVSFNTTTGALSGTPAAGMGGPYSLTFTAHNGVGTEASQSFTLIVNGAAAITSADYANFTVGTAGSFSVTATGYPAPTVTKTGTLPTGVAFNAATGALSGTPAPAAGGVYNISFTAHNGIGADAIQNFTLTVGQAPAITSMNNATFIAGTAGSFAVIATGYPAPSLSSTLLPTGLALDSASGVLSGTPAAGTGGAYSITLTAHNGVGADAQQTFSLTVNEAPSITSANHATFTVGAVGSFTLTASGYPAPTTSLSGNLPGGITFNAGTGVLGGTPVAGTGGTWPVTYTAHNGIGSDATQALTLTVNEAPAVITHPSNLTVNLGQTATFTSLASGSPAPTIQWAVSTDGGTTWNDIPGSTSATLAFTAEDAHHGNLYHAVHTNTAGSATSTSALLTVNTSPLITTAPTTQTACAGSSVSFSTAATGRPSPTVQWQVSTDGGATFTDIVGATSATLLVSANSAMDGYQYRAVVTNAVGTATTAAATLHVNTTPIIATQPTNRTVVHGQSVTFTATVNAIPAPTVQWQVSTDSGGTWNNINGATATTLTFAVSRADNGKQYRAVFTNLCSAATTAAATLTVNKMETTAAVVSSANPSAFGKPVSFTATVQAKAPGAGTPTGTVTFKDGATIIGTKLLDANGIATLTLPSISVGHHLISAEYGGDANAMGSTSLILDQLGANASIYLPLLKR